MKMRDNVPNYDLVIFDVDGTLLDTTEGVLSSVRYTIKEFGFRQLQEEELRTFIGPPIQESFAKVYALQGDILQEMAGVFRNRYKEVDLLKAVPYEGIFGVMQELLRIGTKVAVATYKREDYAIQLLKHFGFDVYSTVMHGADHENKLKKKDIIDLCIRESGVNDLSRIVMVGDTDHDAVGARNAGIDFIGVTYGFGFRKEEDMKRNPYVGCATCAKEVLKYI